MPERSEQDRKPYLLRELQVVGTARSKSIERQNVEMGLVQKLEVDYKCS